MNEPVPPLKAFKVGDATVDLEWLLNAPYEDIGEAAARIPPAIGYLGYHCSVSVERMIIAKHEIEKAEGNVYFRLKNGEFVTKGFGEKMTEESVKRAVSQYPEVSEAHAKFATYRRNIEWLNRSIEALQAKLDLVRSSEATRRMEHEPDTNKRTVV